MALLSTLVGAGGGGFAGAGQGGTVVMFTESNPAFAMPAGVKFWVGAVVGAGGGTVVGGSNPNRGGGGGGGYAHREYTTAPGTLSVTVGGAGVLHTDSGNVTGGGSTSITGSGIVTITGGGGARAETSGNIGGAGGVGSGGMVNHSGGAGGTGANLYGGSAAGFAGDGVLGLGPGGANGGSLSDASNSGGGAGAGAGRSVISGNATVGGHGGGPHGGAGAIQDGVSGVYITATNGIQPTYCADGRHSAALTLMNPCGGGGVGVPVGQAGNGGGCTSPAHPSFLGSATPNAAAAAAGVAYYGGGGRSLASYAGQGFAIIEYWK